MNLTEAQNKADQMADTFTQVAGEKVGAEVYEGIGYVGLRFTFVTSECCDRALRFHEGVGCPAPTRRRGNVATWIFR